MALTQEQVKELKKQLSEQIKNLPDDQKKQAQAEIDAMSSEALEEMLRRQQARQGKEGGQQKGIFRMIVDGDVESKKVDENKEVIAVVSKRAASKGHVLLIPRKTVGEVKSLPNSAFTLAKKIAKKMVSKLRVQDVEIQVISVLGEVVVNVIPVYDKPIDANQTYEVSDGELNEVYERLKTIRKKKIIKVKRKLVHREKVVKLRRRIP